MTSPIIQGVVATDLDFNIGSNNDMPWRGTMPRDLSYFQTVTINNPVLMGRKTYESMGSKPLPHRKNYVLTRRGFKNPNPGTTLLYNVQTALDQIKKENPDAKVISVIGGKEIFKIFYHQLDVWRVNMIQHTYPNCDVDLRDMFTDIQKAFKFIGKLTRHQDDRNRHDLIYYVLMRTRSGRPESEIINGISCFEHGILPKGSISLSAI